jgi:signal peptidase II
MTQKDNERYLWGYIYLFLLAGIVVALDQTTKLLVRSELSVGESWMLWDVLSDYFVIVHTWNTGMSFGLLKGTNGLFIALGEIICILIVFLYPNFIRHRDMRVVGLGLGLILGGAIGNLIDRLAVGYVTDIFLINFLPVFNLADIAIFLGAVILALSLIFDQSEAPISK